MLDGLHYKFATHDSTKILMGK